MSKKIRRENIEKTQKKTPSITTLFNTKGYPILYTVVCGYLWSIWNAISFSWFCVDIVMMYSVLMCTKNEQFKHSSQRNTKVCTNTSPNICTRYKLTLYRGLEVYNLHAYSWEGTRRWSFLNWKSAGRRQFGEGSWRFLFGHVKGYKNDILLNRNTDSIRTIFLYTVLHVVVLNMMECYY